MALFFLYCHKPQNSCWVSSDNRIRWNILCHHAPRTDDRVFTDRDVAENRGTRPNGSTFTNPCLFNFPICLSLQATACACRARIAIVDKRHAMSDKDIVFDIDTFADEGVTRNFAASPDSDVLLNFDECTDFGLITDFATVQIDEIGEFYVLPEPDSRGNTNELTHRYTTSPRLRTDLSAASKSRTTLRPLSPSLKGDLFSWMHFKK